MFTCVWPEAHGPWGVPGDKDTAKKDESKASPKKKNDEGEGDWIKQNNNNIIRPLVHLYVYIYIYIIIFTSHKN